MSYGDPMGHLPFREAIAAYLRTARAVRCEADQIMVVSGSQQALSLTARVLLDRRQPGVGRRAGLWRSARRSPPPRRTARPGAGRRRGVERRRRRPAVPAGPRRVRHALPSIPARHDRCAPRAACSFWTGLGGAAPGSSRTTTTASTGTRAFRSLRCRGSIGTPGSSTSGPSARSSFRRCGSDTSSSPPTSSLASPPSARRRTSSRRPSHRPSSPISSGRATSPATCEGCGRSIASGAAPSSMRSRRSSAPR